MEELLHYCWKHKLFALSTLVTTNGQVVEVIDVGLHNTNAGPDFLNAKVKLDNTVWVGNVEIHSKSSDWYVHHHEQDSRYNNVVLHVTGYNDSKVCTKSGRDVPQVVLTVPDKVWKNYQQLIKEDAYPPCYHIITEMPRITLHSWMSVLQTERLEQKTQEINRYLQQCAGDWEWVLFVTVARNFGFGINGDTFEQWALSFPLNNAAHHRDDLFQIEALFMGQAGLLEPALVPQKYHAAMYAEGYFSRLRNEYLYLQHKFSLHPIDGKLWRFLRLRPQNFPNIRIAQLAYLYYSRKFCLRNLIESKDLKQIKDSMKSDISAYWQTHYIFGAVSKKSLKHLSTSSLNILLINTVIPILFAYGKYHASESMCEKAIDYLEQLKPEQNHIIKMWQTCGLTVENAGDTQALIQLKKKYCDRKECLRCRIGYEYLKGNKIKY